MFAGHHPDGNDLYPRDPAPGLDMEIIDFNEGAVTECNSKVFCDWHSTAREKRLAFLFESERACI